MQKNKETKDKISVPEGKFDDRNTNENTPQTREEVFAPGKELGKINVDGVGEYIFSISGDVKEKSGLDLIMTDADGQQISVISITNNPDGNYEINSDNLVTIKNEMPGHENEIDKIVDEYLKELTGFGVNN